MQSSSTGDLARAARSTEQPLNRFFDVRHFLLDHFEEIAGRVDAGLALDAA